MALPIRHKTASRGWYRPNEQLGYTYVGADDFSDVPTVEDVYNLFSETLFVGPTGVMLKPDITVIISGEFYTDYPGHDPEEVVTTLSYAGDVLTFYETVRAHYDENPNRAASEWINDYVKNMTLRFKTHEWFSVYRVSIVD